jgi:hypothetical protein
MRVSRDRSVLAPGDRLVDECQHDCLFGRGRTANDGLAARKPDAQLHHSDQSAKQLKPHEVDHVRPMEQ